MANLPDDMGYGAALSVARQEMDAQDIQNKVGGLNKFLSGFELEAPVPQFHTGLNQITQPMVGGTGLPPVNKPTIPTTNKEPSYATTQDGPFYRVSRKGNGESGKIATQDDSGIWPNSPADSKGTGPIRYGDTQYDKTTYKPYKVMPADDQNAVLQTAQTYVGARGLPEVSQPKMAASSLEKQAAIGRTYSLAVESSPEYKQEIFDAYKRTMPDVIKQSGAKNYDDLLKSAYDQMAKETAEQFNALNLRYSYHQNGEGNYADSSNMLHDLHDNNHLFVYQGGDKHDFLHNIDSKTGLNENEKFRAVHDAFGHGIYGNNFGPEGEERAWGVHSQMYSPLAQLAMTAETRGQNSFVNYTPANVKINEAIREVESKMAEAKKRGDASNLKELQEAKKSLYGEWNYAPNKSVLLPPEFLSTSYSGEMPSYIQKLIKPAEETNFSSPLTHYSFSPFLGQTDPYQYGTGLRGPERNRVLSGGIKGRSYFYLGEPGTVTPEAGVGPTRYAAQGKNLYNLADDPEKLYRLAKQSNLSSPLSNFNPNSNPHDQIMNDFEKLIRQYGYSGYAQPNQGFPTAVMFDPVTVQRRNIGGTVEDHAMNLVRRYLDHEDDHAA
jgi:cupin superfamily acireductone dioxygenase involved in methionine salvage